MIHQIRQSVLLVALFCASTSLALVACSDDSPTGGSAGDDDLSSDSPTGDINIDGLFPGTDGEAEDTQTGGDATTGDPREDRSDGAPDRSSGFAQRFEPCGINEANCEFPLICLGTCQLPCNAGCPEDEVCIEFEQYPGSGICGHRVGLGEDCDSDLALFCEEGLTCDPEDGVCRQEGVAELGDPCNNDDAVCGEGLVCITYTWSEGFCHLDCSEDPEICGEDSICISTWLSGTACYEDCDATGDPECSSEYYRCQTPMGGEEDACMPRQGGLPGEQQFSEACDDENTCAENLFCTPLLPGAYCTQTCNGGTPCPTDPPGASCTFGMCLFACPNGQTDCPDEAMTCENYFNQALCHW